MRRPSWLVRVLRARRAPASRPRPARPAPPVSPGRCEDVWLVVAPGGGDGPHQARAVRFAQALAAQGLATTFVARHAGGARPESGAKLRVVDQWSLADLSGSFVGCPDRVRVVLGVADAETIALARDLGADGARVAYDGPAPMVVPAPALSYDAETERALVAGVEDLIAADTRTARHLGAQAGGGRLVHVLADDETDPARRLCEVAPGPSVAVLLTSGPEASQTLDAVDQFVTARGDGAYRLVVVASAADPAAPALEALEEDGRLHLLRSAREGLAAAWDLGLSATRSEVVALVHAGQRPDGPGWLAVALEALAEHREVGAVGRHALDVDARFTTGGMESSVVALDPAGLVARRGVLRRAGGVGGEADLGALAPIDLGFRMRDLGVRLAHCSALGVRGDEPMAVGTPAQRRELRRRWAHRPGYLGGPGDP